MLARDTNPGKEIMTHLVLTRRAGQSVALTLDPAADPVKVLQLLMRDGITLSVYEVAEGNVRFSIDAPREISIVRSELLAGWVRANP